MSVELIIHHNAGFFSCCTVRLYKIIEFFNTHKRLPVSIDTSSQFNFFRSYPEEDVDTLFFEIQNNDIVYTRQVNHHDYQFTPYRNLDFKGTFPFIKKYFTPSNNTFNRISFFNKKYNIDYSNTVSVLYRGNDKCTETTIAPYDLFLNKCDELYKKDHTINFLIQTDENEFRNAFKGTFKNSFYIEEIPAINSNPNRVVHNSIANKYKPSLGVDFLGVTYLISKTKHIVTHSGNCGIWTVLYRNNANNVHQILNNIWI